VVWLFGAFLILTGLKMLFAPVKGLDPDRNPLIRLFRRFVPVTTALHGQSFFVRQAGRLAATPLFVTLLFVEITDIIFAVDSVPAIYALTDEPLIVFTSNVFAILGLRALYFMLGGAVTRFHLLRYGLALVLIFVGLKMAWLNDLWDGKFPIGWSLAVIGALIGASLVLSLVVAPRTAAAGSASPSSTKRTHGHDAA
jgi:tellurite resistance protein TerC